MDPTPANVRAVEIAARCWVHEAGEPRDAGDHIDGNQFAGLRKLRDRLGTSFVAGLAFHLGRRGYEAEDRLHVLPLERLWI